MLSLLRHSAGFTEEQRKLIKSGMTEEEVESILGCPPGDYTSDGYFLGGSRFSFEYSKTWAGPSGVIEVVFDGKSRRAVLAEYTPTKRSSWFARTKGFLSRLLRF
jgi:hypothetical protein